MHARHLVLSTLLAGTVALTLGAAPAAPAEPAPQAPSATAAEGAFVAGAVPLRNARVGDAWTARVDGLLTGPRAGVRFRKVSGAPWIEVDGDGRLRGTPGPRAGTRTDGAVVEAVTPSGTRTRTRVEVDVRDRDQRLVPRVAVLSWNMWHGGTQVDGHLPKQLRFLLQHDVDVVGVQEGDDTTARLARRLGWYHHSYGGSVGVLSRYPLARRGAERDGLPAIDTVVRLDDRTGDRFALWNVHLGYTPYGPYDACFGQMTEPELMAREAESGRTAQIEGVVAAMRPDLRRSSRTPALLTGDFNAPSHLDWTARTDRCGYEDGVAWPTSTVPTRAGLVDTFRAVHPDPLRTPGTTWSPVYETFTGGYGHDEHTGEPEPQDRIDLVYAAGGWDVLDSRTLVAGDPAPIPDHEQNEWTSDHAAVLTTLRVR